MSQFITILLAVIWGLLLLWFGYSLFFMRRKKRQEPQAFLRTADQDSLSGREPRSEAAARLAGSSEPRSSPRFRRPAEDSGRPGAAQTCPVCSARLEEGELIKSSVFPSFNGEERIMHIRGCPYCLTGNRDRHCPVCKVLLKSEEVLIARMYDHHPGKPHIHVLGCSRCRF
jgi:hypothetical protein